FCPIRRSILYLASGRLVIASSLLVLSCEDRALLCPGHAGTDRFWPKRRAKPRVAKHYASQKGPRNAGCLVGKPRQVKRLAAISGPFSEPSTDLLVDVDLDRAGQQRAPRLQIGLHPWIAGHALPVKLDEFVGVVFDLVHEPGGVVDI